jgi:flavin reductase (DIM6/NTAB) family NADH-FMN oxidoreductase RutF
VSSAPNGRMSIVKNIRRAIGNVVFGDTVIPQEFTIGLTNPQAEIVVWLHGMGAPRDVTSFYSTACCAPFVLCIAFEKGKEPSEKQLKRLSLEFCERTGQKRVLGKIGLKPAKAVTSTAGGLFFFEVRSSANYCLPSMRLGAHYLRESYSLWRNVNSSGIEMSLLERRAAIVTFIRPHPISLVSVLDSHGGNIFTMNIMNDLGHGHFAFALKHSRTAAPLVERAGRLALSNIPLQQTRIAFQLAANHFKQSIEWDQLPFQTKPSTVFRIPVPVFALRVREMKVEEIHKIGSHTFFVAKIVSDETFDHSEMVCAIHGFYQAWRLRGREAELKESLVQDRLNKKGA